MDGHSQIFYQLMSTEECLGYVFDPIQCGLFNVHLEYMRFSYEPEYEEADERFSRGLIEQSHSAKLCGPKEILVGSVDGQPSGV